MVIAKSKKYLSILPIWQPVGYSTHIISKKVSEKYGIKTSHTGTLDPMAEGVIIILLGEERLKKYEYAKWHKTYEFEILFGIETDTYDGMGLITNTCDNSRIDIEHVLADFIGKYSQTVPLFSTKKVNGKHLHEYARLENTVNLPTKNGEIFSLELLSTREVFVEDIKKALTSKINKVTGDFRQKEIISGWQNHNFTQEKYKIAKLKVVMTKGLYVRSLSVDIAKKLNTCSFSYSITRTHNGEYNKQNSKTLEEIFGSNFLDKYDFVSRFKS